jgi:hypothetical protein
MEWSSARDNRGGGLQRDVSANDREAAALVRTVAPTLTVVQLAEKRGSAVQRPAISLYLVKLRRLATGSHCAG